MLPVDQVTTTALVKIAGPHAYTIQLYNTPLFS